MKKIIGLVLWLVCFLLPFRYAILDTEDLVREDGSIDNMTGLISFLAMLALFFIGYALIDGSPKQGQEAHGH
jgi:hypothetical protein